MKDRLHLYQGHRVEVRAHGILYHGRLVGTDEEFLYLRGETTWLTLDLEAVTAVKPEGGAEHDWMMKTVDGEPFISPEQREEKRRYNQADLEKIYLMNLACDWPEEEENRQD